MLHLSLFHLLYFPISSLPPFSIFLSLFIFVLPRLYLLILLISFLPSCYLSFFHVTLPSFLVFFPFFISFLPSYHPSFFLHILHFFISFHPSLRRLQLHRSTAAITPVMIESESHILNRTWFPLLLQRLAISREGGFYNISSVYLCAPVLRLSWKLLVLNGLFCDVGNGCTRLPTPRTEENTR